MQPCSLIMIECVGTCACAYMYAFDRFGVTVSVYSAAHNTICFGNLRPCTTHWSLRSASGGGFSHKVSTRCTVWVPTRHSPTGRTRRSATR